MPIGMIFWAMMLFWLIFGFFNWRNPSWQYGTLGHSLFIFLLFFWLGWADFGFIVQGGRGSPFH